MALTTELKFQLPAVGVQTGVVRDVIDLGLQTTTFNGQTKIQQKLFVIFELPDTKTSTGQRSTISKFFTNSAHPKSELKPFKDAVMKRKLTIPEAANLSVGDLVGKTVDILVEHVAKQDGSVNAKITKFIPTAKSVALDGKSIVFDTSKPDEAVFNQISEGIRKMIKIPVSLSDINQGDESDGLGE